MKKKYQGFFNKYRHVYVYISILMAVGFCVGIIASRFINVQDIDSLSSYLTSVDGSMEKYDYFISQFFMGIVFVIVVFILGTSIMGIPFISFVVFSKGLQIGFSSALFICTYHMKGIVGILLTLLPQVLFDVLTTYLISASAIQLSMYIVYSCSSRERLSFKKLLNSVLNDILICFILVFISSYLKSTLVIEFIKLFNLLK